VANTDAVSAVCDAIVHILKASMQEQAAELNFDSVSPAFAVFTAKDFTRPSEDGALTTGASVFLYRVAPNLSHRTPAGRQLPDGRRLFNKLPLDLYIIVTIWAGKSSTQNRLVGWVLRTLEDYPVIPASVLNLGRNRPVFEDEEAVELAFSEINGEELLQLWDVLGNGELQYQISVPYLARNVFIDSRRMSELGEPVQIRTADMQRVNGDSS
jgi:hypothetical protein